MLIGQYNQQVLRRRVAIPVNFRKLLGKRLIVSKWYEGCLVLVNFDSWKLLLDRVTGETRVITQPVREVDRFILGSAYELKTDTQGRVVLPEALVDYADLGKRAVFLGLRDRVEIWGYEKWLEKEKEVVKTASKLTEELAK